MQPEKTEGTGPMGDLAKEIVTTAVLSLLSSPMFICGLTMFVVLAVLGYRMLGVPGALVGGMLGFIAGFIGALIVRVMSF